MMSLQKKSPLNIKKNRFKSDIADITMGMNRLQLSAISKAASLQSVVKDVTIGPYSRHDISNPSFESENGDISSDLITSTPRQEKYNRTQTNKSEILKKSLFDISNIEKEESASESFKRKKEILKRQFLSNLEKTRKEEVYERVLNKIESMKDEENKIKQSLEKTNESIQDERACATEDLAIQKMLKEEELQTKLSFQNLTRSKLSHAKRLNETSERIKESERLQNELEEKEKQMKRESRICLDKIYEKQVEYRKIYQEILNVSKTCKDSREFLELVSPEAQKLKVLNETVDSILQKCEERTVGQLELKTAQTLVEQVTHIYKYFVQCADKINERIQRIEDDAKAAVEKKAKEEKEKEEKAKEEKAKQAAVESNLSALADCVDKESLAKNTQLMKFLEKYEKSLEPLIKDNTIKKFRFDCQKAVNVPVNAISHLNNAHLEDKFLRLLRLLRGESVPVGNIYMTAASHPLGVAFCTNLLAKKFVKQGEHTVSSKPEAAFAIAAVIVALWVEIPDFGQLLLAHFQKECPYLIPAYMPQVEGQSNEDYYRTLGYQYSEDGKVETQDKFIKRMSGIMRLYSAILITKLKRSQANKRHPLGINEAWRWLASTLNLGPRPDISATLIFDLLDVTGNLFYKTYGSQFQKLMFVLCRDYFPQIEKVSHIFVNYKTYGSQFQKLMFVLCRDYFPQIEKVSHIFVNYKTYGSQFQKLMFVLCRDYFPQIEKVSHIFVNYKTYGSQFQKLMFVLCRDYFPQIEKVSHIFVNYKTYGSQFQKLMFVLCRDYFPQIEKVSHIFVNYKTYGSQFQKLMFVLCRDYFPQIEKITPDGCGGPVCRLKAFLERILIEGQIPPPDGLLPPNFW